MTTIFKWCEKSTALATSLHNANMEKGHKVANSTEALKIIGAAVADQLKHNGKEISAQSVRSKLSSAGAYTAYTAPSANDGDKLTKPTTTKADLAVSIKKLFGLDIDIEESTLANANRPILEALERCAKLLPHNVAASPQKKVELAESLEDAESDAINAGVSLSAIDEIEQDAIDKEVSLMGEENNA